MSRWMIVLCCALMLSSCHGGSTTGAFAGPRDGGNAGMAPSEVVADAAALEGSLVTVTGVVRERVACTTMGCSPSQPCCNQCGGPLILVDGLDDEEMGIELVAGPRMAGGFTCSGTNCEITCDPLEVDVTYLVTGVLYAIDHDADKGGSWTPYVISVQSYRPL